MKDYLRKVNQILNYEPDPAFARRAGIIFENLNLFGDEKVLEIGCGRGFYLKTLIEIFPDLKITGIDLKEEYLSTAKKFINNEKIELLKADATKLPFKNETFDRIIASEILEHIIDDQKAISEIFRVLKPEGLVMITVPNKNYPFFWDPLNWILEKLIHWHLPANIWWLAGLWADHVRLYDFSELQNKFQKAGFKIDKSWFATHYCFPFSHFLLYGIGKNLVEKGLFPNCNRFSGHLKPTKLRKILFWPILKVDSFNKKAGKTTSVNLVLRVVKEENKKQKEGNDILD